MNRGQVFAVGAATGASLTYLFDPARGRRRRALMRDQGVRLEHRSVDAADTVRRDLRNRARGICIDARKRLTPMFVTDDVLRERVRARIGRVVSHPHAIEVDVSLGLVKLRGPVLASEVERLASAVSRMRGVIGVVNDLEIHAAPDAVSGLQGEPRPRESQPEFLQVNWSPAARAIATAAGGALVLGGARGRGLAGTVAGATGMALIARAATNIELPRLIGVGGRRRGTQVAKTINIDAPVDEVYAFWTEMQNYPRFMSHVREVQAIAPETYRWVVDGPAGAPVEWEARITERVPNQKLAWQSVPGSPIEQSGVTRFDANPDGSTRVTVRLTYNPPAGAVGHVVATLFQRDPKHEMVDDLLRLKSLMESGHTTAHGERVSWDELMGEPAPPSDVAPG